MGDWPAGGGGGGGRGHFHWKLYHIRVNHDSIKKDPVNEDSRGDQKEFLTVDMGQLSNSNVDCCC